MKPDYEQLLDHQRQISLLRATQSLLGWDQETMMPQGRGAAEYRSRQAAQLAGMVHRLQTDERIPQWLGACESDASLMADPDGETATNIREIRREYRQAVALPAALVEEFSQTTSLAKHAWAAARKAEDYAAFEPWLERIIHLCRARAECWGYAPGGELWDALADHHEPGMSVSSLLPVLNPLRESLVALMHELLAGPRRPTDRMAGVSLSCDLQRSFNRAVVEKLGFDFSRGRSDESSHPFCLPLHRDDVRMTSRYRSHLVLDGLGSALHEAGHGIYNQNLPAGDGLDLPAGMPLRYAVHESQARLIENHVGRSRSFWSWCGPVIRKHFSPSLDHVPDEGFFESDNSVEPGLIRTESDELTYNLHITIRFELERAMIRGDLNPCDLPGAWHESYHKTLGVTPPSDAQGCLQDIHWAMGAIGYFPTYTLGNLYAAQLFEAMEHALPDVHAMMASGEFTPLVQWLKSNIHAQGRRYNARELIEKATGCPVTAEPLLRHLRTKLAPLYGIG